MKSWQILTITFAAAVALVSWWAFDSKPPTKAEGKPEAKSEAKSESRAEVLIFTTGNLEFAKDVEFKWQVRVRDSRFEPCSGVIVADAWIVTAAHCLTTKHGKPNFRRVRVLAGTRTIQADDEDELPGKKVEQLIVHPDFNRCIEGYPREFDIALIRMDSLRSMGNDISVIPMAKKDDSLPANITFAGWAYDLDEHLPQAANRRLAYTTIRLLPHEVCKLEYMSEKFLCGSGVDSGFEMTDSGGGLVAGAIQAPELIGIAIYDGSPEFYSRVSVNREWVELCVGDPQNARCKRNEQVCR